MIAETLEDDFHTIQNELTLATSKLEELKSEFAQKELQDIPTSTYQEMSSALSHQRAIVEQLTQHSQKIEAELGEMRRKDTLTSERQQKRERWLQLTQQMVEKRSKTQRSEELRAQMKQQEESLEQEINNKLLPEWSLLDPLFRNEAN